MPTRNSLARVVELPTTAVDTVYAMGDHPLPGTLWVRPTSGNTLTVDYSTDNGANYQSLTALTGATAYSECQVLSGFTNLKITTSGVQGGTWGVC